MPPPSVLHTITAVMEAQRAALLAGDFTGLDATEARLARAVEKLSGAGLSRDDLACIAALAARNARLLDAARSGIARARGRTRAGPAAALMTYDARGHQRGGAPVGQTLSRR
jgi:hypothetical protein